MIGNGESRFPVTNQNSRNRFSGACEEIGRHMLQSAKCDRAEQYYLRQRPYCVEYTRSHPNSEVKQRKARSVLGWGTAWEVLRVLLAFIKLYVWSQKSRLTSSWTWPLFCNALSRTVQGGFLSRGPTLITWRGKTKKSSTAPSGEVLQLLKRACLSFCVKARLSERF